MTVILGKGGPSANGWHAMSYMLECPKKYQLAKVRGISTPMAFAPDPLATGSMFHAMRARWFANKFDMSTLSWQSIQTACEECKNELPAPASHTAERLALSLMTQYMEWYSKLPLPNPVAAEYLIEGKLNAEDDERVTFSARLDDVSYYPEFGGKLCIGEGKTASDTGGALSEYQMHGQPMLQVALWMASQQGEAAHGPVAGVVLDIVRKPQVRNGKEGKAAFTRQVLQYTPKMLAWHIRNLREYKRQAVSMSPSDDPSRNVTSCTRMYGRMRVPCQYQELCKFGKTAAGNYVLVDGSNLADWKPSFEGEVAPWE